MLRALLWSLLFSSLTASSAFAKGWSWFGSSEEKAQKPRIARVPTPTSIVIAPSLLVADNGAAPGVIAQFSTPVMGSTPLFFTVDFGPYFYSNYFGTSVAIAALAGMDYRFALPRTKIRPLFGVNFGPAFGRRVVFAMLFRPGVDFPLSADVELNLETRFGVIASSFVFLPQFGVRFVL